jgi:hypothetical protein
MRIFGKQRKPMETSSSIRAIAPVRELGFTFERAKAATVSVLNH